MYHHFLLTYCLSFFLKRFILVFQPKLNISRILDFSVVQVLKNIDDDAIPAGEIKDLANIQFRLKNKYDSLKEEREAICK